MRRMGWLDVVIGACASIWILGCGAPAARSETTPAVEGSRAPSPDPAAISSAQQLEWRADTESASGDLVQAAADLRTAIAIRAKAEGPAHVDVAKAIVRLSRLELRACRAEDAQRDAAGALSLLERGGRPAPAPWSAAMEAFGEARWLAGDDAGALAFLERTSAALRAVEATQWHDIVRLAHRRAAMHAARFEASAVRAVEEDALATVWRRTQAGADREREEVLMSALDAYRAVSGMAWANALLWRTGFVERVKPQGAVVLAELAVAKRDCEGPSYPSDYPGNSSSVASLASSFSRCFNAALRLDPDFAPHVRVSAGIHATGRVLGVRAVVPAQYPAPFVDCLLDAVYKKAFSPAKTDYRLIIPIGFVLQ